MATPLDPKTLLHVPTDFDREAWLDAPECRGCNRTLSLRENCEWPEDPRLLLCHDCMHNALEAALSEIDVKNVELEVMRTKHADDVSDLRSEVNRLEGRIEGLRERS